jgi:23S rRNA pseudouridine1911/1915/1917 synthase
MPSFTVRAESAGTRFDALLAAELGITRVKALALIKSGHATVNGKPLKPHGLLREGQVVEALMPEEVPPTPVKQPKLDVVFEDDDVLVVNKPAGLLVHPTNEHDDSPSLAGAAVKHFPALAQVGDNPLRPGIVHRLDKDVSGVMVIAKNNATFTRLKSHFKNREVGKEYIALVYGNVPKAHDIITLKIARSKAKGRMVSRPESQEGKEAITEYDVLDRFKTNSLLQVKIHTGRTHQIRTHMRAINHPVVGDTLYGKVHMKHIRPIPLGRLFLHSEKLTIPMANGSEQTFVSPLPAELAALLKTLPRT